MPRLTEHRSFWDVVGMLIGFAGAGCVFGLAELIAHTWPNFHP